MAYLLFLLWDSSLILLSRGETSPPLTQWTNGRWGCRDGQAHCDGAAVFSFCYLWRSTGAGPRGRRLSSVSSRNQTVSPHRGHEKKSRGITRECFPPWPSLLSLLLHLLLLFFLPSPHSPFLLTSLVLYFWWEAFSGNGRGSGIVFWDQWKFRSESTSRVLLFAVWSSRLTALSSALWISYDARCKNGFIIC